MSTVDSCKILVVFRLSNLLAGIADLKIMHLHGLRDKTNINSELVK